MGIRAQATPWEWPAALQKRFRIVIFDWDGTAVPDRHSDARGLARDLGRLLAGGTRCVIVTGTKLENIEKQCTSLIRGPEKERLIVCTNRGSEVFGFDPSGRPKVLYRYEASAGENAALDRTARTVQRELAVLGLVNEVVFDRLNRRKIDLIPLPRWKDPKKSEFGELLGAVRARLREAGIIGAGPGGGLGQVLDLSRRAAKESGIALPRITSDIKHVEVGLTDKGDSVRWAKKNLIDKTGTRPEDVVLVGDEFGGIGGLSGSDSLMRIEGLEKSVFVSVGVEPNGVPSGVLPLGGGPRRFGEFVREQSELWWPRLREQFFLRDPSWLVEEEGFDPSREGEMETLFTLGNGYLGVRGASDLAIPSSKPDLFLAGIYDRRAPAPAYSGPEFVDSREDPFCALVAFPSPFPFRIWIDEEELKPGRRMLRHSRRLDMEKGMSLEEWEFEDREGKKTFVSATELASLSRPNLLLQEIEIRCASPRAQVRVDTRLIDPDLELKYPRLLLSHPEKPPGLSDVHVFHTRTSRISVEIAARILLDGALVRNPEFLCAASPSRPIVIRKFASISSDRDPEGIPRFPKERFSALDWEDFAREVRSHAKAWREVWQGADMVFEGDPSTTQAQRFNSYHLRISADHDPRISTAARGLSGRAYEGHVFWDSEIFVLPFFIHRFPEIAQSMLRYRYETLPGARRRARQQGYAGACFAWESTLTGDDVTPEGIRLKGTDQTFPILTGVQQIHITADVAYGIRRYWEATGDDDFMLRWGVEILIETARFWQSRVSERDGRYHLLKVIGPDEYHPGINDNAYTNWMAKFNLDTAVALTSWLEHAHPARLKELQSALGLKPQEVKSWRDTSGRLFVPAPNERGIIEQFEGFFGLKRPNLEKRGLLRSPLPRLFVWKELGEEQLIKQADVLMIPFLFPRAFSPEVVRANYEFYEPVTDHGSSLSPCVHSAVAARVGKWEAAEEFWKLALDLDVMNSMRNTALGIHLANMGGAWQSLVFHFLGIDFDKGVLSANPQRQVRIPARATRVEFNLLDHGQSVRFDIRGKGV